MKTGVVIEIVLVAEIVKIGATVERYENIFLLLVVYVLLVVIVIVIVILELVVVYYHYI